MEQIGKALMAAFLFFIPAYVANMSPLIAKNTLLARLLPWSPLDGNVQLGKRPLIGKNKTIGGFVAGVFGGLLAAFVLYLMELYGNNWFILGLLFGFGAMLGDAVKSFLKRRLGMGNGQCFFPMDQIDFILGAWILVGFYIGFTVETLEILIYGIIITSILHLVVNFIAYAIKWKEVWW